MTVNSKSMQLTVTLREIIQPDFGRFDDGTEVDLDSEVVDEYAEGDAAVPPPDGPQLPAYSCMFTYDPNVAGSTVTVNTTVAQSRRDIVDYNRLVEKRQTAADGSIQGIPLYNADDEAERGIPHEVQLLKNQLDQADGLLLFTPEYNNSIPGVMKNAIDWMTRPDDDLGRLFGGCPVAVLGASPGRFGTLLSQDAWLSVIRALKMRPWYEGRLLVSGAHSVFDADGRMADDATCQRLKTFLAGFVTFSNAA